MIRTLCTIDTCPNEQKDKKFNIMSKSKGKNNNVFNNKKLMTIEYDCTIQPRLSNAYKK